MSERGQLRFRHEVIDPDPPGWRHDITLLGDISGNGRTDIVIGGKEGEVNLFWYENPGWERHDMAAAPNLEAGGVLLDISGDGRLDVVAGQQTGGHELFWFECPADPRERWPRRTLEDRFEQYHDQAAGDLDGDGEAEIVFISQRSGVLAYYDLPDDPREEPWPRECFHLIAEDAVDVEGLAIVDLDGDGRCELIAGPTIYRREGDRWEREPLGVEFEKTRVAVADLCDRKRSPGDGLLDIVLAEGESHPARLAWLRAPDWEAQVLRDDLFHPHSLEMADFDGDGLPDIFVGEMGLGRNAEPRLIIYLNRGGGEFEEVVIERGVATHEAKVADLTGDGRPDIVGKPYDPERHIDVWFNEG